MATVFTKIVNGDIPSHKVYEDEDHLAFLTIDPFSDGHTLVIPKQEYEHIWQMPEEEYKKLWSVAKKVAVQIDNIFKPERIGTFVDGAEVPHVHIHLVPVQKGSLSALIRSHKEITEPDHAKLEQIAKKLKFKE